MKNILIGAALFLALSLVIIFADDIRNEVNQALAAHGHQKTVTVQVHGCAIVNGVKYCVDTATAEPTK